MRPSRRRTRVLVVGQVPPPHHGQAVMVETLLRGRYTDVDLLHLDASYSDSLDQLGGISARKVGRMLVVVARALWLRIARRPTILYYHPAGSNPSAIVRDIFVLGVLRPIFPMTVFHHHARGLVPAIADLPPPLRALARAAFGRVDVAIAPSTALRDEVAELDPARALVIPNGTAGGTPAEHRPADGTARLLFLNLISEAKGARWLLEAVGELHRRDIPVHATFAGDFPSPAERDAFVARVHELDLQDHVHLPGLVTGEEKWATFRAADVFCVPTTYRQESFGLAAVEAASCGSAIVTTDVPGVRDVFTHGVDAVLVDPDEPAALTDALALVCTDADRRRTLGARARSTFEERYTEDRYWAALDGVFTDLAVGNRTSAPRQPTNAG